MSVMVLFHHHSSIYNEDWSKPGFGRVCSNPRYLYYSLVFHCLRISLSENNHYPKFIKYETFNQYPDTFFNIRKKYI